MTRVCGDVKNGWEFCDEKGVLLSPPRMVRKLECVESMEAARVLLRMLGSLNVPESYAILGRHYLHRRLAEPAPDT